MKTEKQIVERLDTHLQQYHEIDEQIKLGKITDSQYFYDARVRLVLESAIDELQWILHMNRGVQ